MAAEPRRRSFGAGVRRIAVAAGLAALAAAAPLPAVAEGAPAVPDSREQISLSFAPLVESTAPSVVNIYAQRVVREQMASPLFADPFFQRFFGAPFRQQLERDRVQNSLGSGVIVSPDGLVVTNHHVIANADEIKVILPDLSEYAAELVLSDERTDLAVLRLAGLDGRTLAAIALADSDGLAVGDLVLAIGNPFGVGQTVTSGIVSALARTAVGVTDYNFFIQTDAAINPGNSGGALVDMSGRLVGINTAIFSRSGGSLGIGFAVPSNMVRVVLASAARGDMVLRPWLGADGQRVTAEIAESLGMATPGGVLVNRVHPAGPAARAGITVGDIIVSVDGQPVLDPEGLRFRVAVQPLDGVVPLGILRDGGPSTLPLAIELPPEDPPREATEIRGRVPLSGAVIGNLSPAVAEDLALRVPETAGAVVLEVMPGSPAARLGLETGDLVLRLNGVEIGGVDGLIQVLDRPVQRWRISVRRGDRVLETSING